jgi:hypothetical protein
MSTAPRALTRGKPALLALFCLVSAAVMLAATTI